MAVSSDELRYHQPSWTPSSSSSSLPSRTLNKLKALLQVAVTDQPARRSVGSVRTAASSSSFAWACGEQAPTTSIKSGPHSRLPLFFLLLHRLRFDPPHFTTTTPPVSSSPLLSVTMIRNTLARTAARGLQASRGPAPAMASLARVAAPIAPPKMLGQPRYQATSASNVVGTPEFDPNVSTSRPLHDAHLTTRSLPSSPPSRYARPSPQWTSRLPPPPARTST